MGHNVDTVATSSIMESRPALVAGVIQIQCWLKKANARDIVSAADGDVHDCVEPSISGVSGLRAQLQQMSQKLSVTAGGGLEERCGAVLSHSIDQLGMALKKADGTRSIA